VLLLAHSWWRHSIPGPLLVLGPWCKHIVPLVPIYSVLLLLLLLLLCSPLLLLCSPLLLLCSPLLLHVVLLHLLGIVLLLLLPLLLHVWRGWGLRGWGHQTALGRLLVLIPIRLLLLLLKPHVLQLARCGMRPKPCRRLPTPKPSTAASAPATVPKARASRGPV